MRRGLSFGMMIVLALAAFELFNYSTTDFALTNLIGDLKFAGLRWATVLALAFCVMDFGGVARLFTPGRTERPAEVWYLVAAWFLAAGMNALLTWWAVSVALLDHANLGNELLSREQLVAGVPIFVAVLVWLIRMLLIGTFTMSGSRLFGEVAVDRADAMPMRAPAAGASRRPAEGRAATGLFAARLSEPVAR